MAKWFYLRGRGCFTRSIDIAGSVLYAFCVAASVHHVLWPRLGLHRLLLQFDREIQLEDAAIGMGYFLRLKLERRDHLCAGTLQSQSDDHNRNDHEGNDGRSFAI